jgi:hypothetical protein
MDRRAFLAGLAASAGCSGLGSEASTTVTPAPVRTPESRDTPASAGQRFDDIGCPSFLSSSLRRVCSHRLPADPILALEPRPVVTRVGPENELVDPVWLTLRSNVDQELTVFTASWALYRYDEGNWTTAATGSGDGGGTTLPGGGRYYWVLHSDEHDRSGTGVTDGRVTLSPGRYAFAVVAITELARTTVECIALFEVVRSGSA